MRPIAPMRHIVLVLILAVTGLLAGCATTEQDPTANWSAERFYMEAKKNLEDYNWKQAVKYFEQLESRYPYGRYTEQAQLEIAYAYYKDDESALGLAAADRFIRMHPTHANVDYAYYLKGLINFHGERSLLSSLLNSKDDLSDRDLRGTRESYNAFRELVERFPKSRYAKDAEQRMTYLVHAQARYEIQVARYYLQRGAYVAAVNRAKYALEHYPRASAVEDALGIQALAYKRLGLTKLADDTVRVLKKNFPESRYFEEIEAASEPG
jgi:outer membrane protein assembly factor BamD